MRTENKHRSEAVAKYYELELILNVNRLEMIYHATSTCTRPWQVGKKLGSRFVEVGHELSIIFSNAKVTPLESEFYRHDEEWPDADISHLHTEIFGKSTAKATKSLMVVAAEVFYGNSDWKTQFRVSKSLPINLRYHPKHTDRSRRD